MTYIPRQGDFAILYVARGTLGGDPVPPVRAIYVTEETGRGYWLDEHGVQRHWSDRAITQTVPVRTANEPKSEKPTSPLFDTLLRVVTDAYTKPQPSQNTSQKLSDVWEFVTDQVTTIIKDAAPPAPEPEAREPEREEPTAPGSIVVCGPLRTRWMKTFAGTWENEDGVQRSWDLIKHAVVEVL